jgi:non-ribosomal peptide synthetase component F
MLNRMKRLCTGAGVTPFHFLLAAFRSFLYRYTEESDITIHMIDGNRPHPDLQETIGFFVNMIPIRCSSDIGDTFDRILDNTKAQTLEALKHNAVPFDVIVDSVDVPKDPSVFPLGQVVVNYQMHGTLPTYSTKDFTMSSPDSDDVPSACEIALEALEDPVEGLKLRLEYSTTLYAQDDATRFMENFLVFLTSTVKDHRQPVAEIEICGPSELQLQKAHFWGTQTTEDWWHGKSVLEKIYTKAKQNPTALAIKSSDGTLITYEDLLARARTVSTVIQSLGIVPGSCIGLFCEPGIEAITGMLAALYSRCGYLALDPNFAPNRLAYMVTDSNVDVVLVGEGLRDVGIDITKKTGISPKTIHISETYCSGTHEMGPPPVADSKDSFFTIYTSVG